MLAIISIAAVICMYAIPLSNNIMFPWEIVFPLILSVPILLYGRNSFKPLLILYMASQSVTIITRYLMLPILIENHQLLTPVSKDTILVRQCIGLSQIIGWVVWNVVIIIYCRHYIRKIINEQTDFASVMNNKKISRLINIYSLTSATSIIFFPVSILTFKLYDYSNQIIIFITISLICIIAVFIEITKTIRTKKEELLDEKDGNDNITVSEVGTNNVDRKDIKESELSVLPSDETSVTTTEER